MSNSDRRFRVLVVDDFEPWRLHIRSLLETRPELHIVGEIADGLEAVHKAQELHPDLIVLDIGLPALNGIQAARRIRTLSPQSKILFISQESSAEAVRGALGTGAMGYVAKADVGDEFMTAVNAVLRGEMFVGKRFAGLDITGVADARTPEGVQSNHVLASLQQDTGIARRHAAGFYSDDRCLLDDLTPFIGGALKAGNAAVVVATESHRDSLLARLQAHGLDIGAAIQQERYIALDAGETLSTLMVNGLPDTVRGLKLLSDLIVAAGRRCAGGQNHVAVFGECAHLLWAQGNAEAAIRFEKLGNQLIEAYDVDILCGYSLSSVEGGMDSHIFRQICAEHSAVHSW